MKHTIEEYQEALKDIELALNKSSTLSAYWFNSLLDKVSTLQELVDKATPKKPDNVWEHLGFTNYTCPTCASWLTSPADGFTKVCKRELYCYRCGQALDWSEYGTHDCRIKEKSK